MVSNSSQNYDRYPTEKNFRAFCHLETPGLLSDCCSIGLTYLSLDSPALKQRKIL